MIGDDCLVCGATLCTCGPATKVETVAPVDLDASRVRRYGDLVPERLTTTRTEEGTMGDRTYYEDASGVRRLKNAGDGPERAERAGYREAIAGEEVTATGGDRTVAELREALDGAGIDYPADAKKADLVKLADDAGI